MQSTRTVNDVTFTREAPGSWSFIINTITFFCHKLATGGWDVSTGVNHGSLYEWSDHVDTLKTAERMAAKHARRFNFD